MSNRIHSNSFCRGLRGERQREIKYRESETGKQNKKREIEDSVFVLKLTDNIGDNKQVVFRNKI